MSVAELPPTDLFGSPARSPVSRLCQSIALTLSSVDLDECLAAELEPTGALSIHGRSIAMREYPALDGRNSLGRVLLFGGIHGDEYSSVSIVFKWLPMLAEAKTRQFHWRVVPLLNPDGLLRRTSRRMNANGVDLNRNFPAPDWLEATRDYWIRRTGRNPRRYPGPAPLSEPESRWLVEEIVRFEPDVIVAVHAPFSVLDFDGPSENPPQRLGPLRLRLLGTYPGSLGRYAGVHRQLPVVTIELPSAGTMPSTEAQAAMWRDLVDWLAENLRETPDGSTIAAQ